MGFDVAALRHRLLRLRGGRVLTGALEYLR